MIGKRKRRVHVFRGKDNDWRWQLKAGNGEIISTSGEGYKNLDDCVVIATEVNPGIEPFPVAGDWQVRDTPRAAR